MKRHGRIGLQALVMVLVTLIPACGGVEGATVHWTPQARLVAARATFDGTVRSLAALREAGTFTKDEAESISVFIYGGARLLDRWQAEIELEAERTGGIVIHTRAYDAFARELKAILRELIAARIAADRAAAKKAPEPAGEPPPVNTDGSARATGAVTADGRTFLKAPAKESD